MERVVAFDFRHLVVDMLVISTALYTTVYRMVDPVALLVQVAPSPA